MGKQILSRGFTIVELLIVIVVIGILAAITIVAYNGVQRSAIIAALKADLKNAQTQLEVSKLDTGSYPSNASGITFSESTTPGYVRTDDSYCVSATSNSMPLTFRLESSTGVIEEASCPPAPIANEPDDCPVGFIPVPGSATYGTQGGFCVMKYEAKQASATIPVSQAGGAPWVYVSQTNAITYSENVAGCTSCHLITEAEWMTITHNVLNVASNWSGGSVGGGYLYSGNNDNGSVAPQAASTNDTQGYVATGQSSGNQRRTLTLSNGEVIWDLAGNIWEWTTGAIPGNQQPGLASDSGYSYKEWNNGSLIRSGLPATAVPAYGTPAAAGWTSAHGIGQLISNHNSSESTRGFHRGGGWQEGVYVGVFSLSVGFGANSSADNVGFRVAR